MDFGKVLGTWVTFFEREGFRFATVGAFGLHAYERLRSRRGPVGPPLDLGP